MFAHMYRMLASADPEWGQGLVEYALLIILIGIVMIVVMVLLGPTIGNLWSSIIYAV